MNKYISTFYTNYGAVKFHRDCQKRMIPAKPMPVPRRLSASCGTCVQFEVSFLDINRDQEDLEACYLVLADGKYRKELQGDGHP